MAEVSEVSDIISNSGFSNYLRLQMLLHNGSEVLRDLFVTEWNLTNEIKWEDSGINGNHFITGPGKDLYQNCSKIQKEHLTSGNIMRWDLSLLIQAAQCLNIDTQYNIFQKLKSLRNKFAHLGEPKVTDKEYYEYWKEISILLLKLNVPPDEIEKIKTMPIETFDKSVETLDPAIQQLKDLGNKALKEKLYVDGIKLYTEAICTPGVSNKDLAVLYSNRSFAFFQDEDLSSAKEDAKCSIHLCPTWYKGYFRLAMTYKASEKYQLALKNFLLAQRFYGKSSELDNNIRLCKRLIVQTSREDHFDSVYFCKTYEEMCKRIPNSTPESLRFYDNLGTKYVGATGPCTQGHNYYLGRGVQQDYKEAAKWYGKAAAKGNAEGMYNLALMTMFGKGIKCSFFEGLLLLKQATSKPNLIEYSKECHIPNLGVKEAQHSFGLLYELGTELPEDYEKSRFWYTKAIRNWCGASANNMAVMYLNGTGVPKCSDSAFQFWKLGAAMGNVRCMENLAREFFMLQDFLTMQRWYLYAVEHGSIALKSEPSLEYQAYFEDEILKNFRKEEFDKALWHEIEIGPLKGLIVPEVKRANDFVTYIRDENVPNTPVVSVPKVDLSTADSHRLSIILEHRKLFNEPNRKCIIPLNGDIVNLEPKRVTDLINLKPIYLNEMNKRNKDYIYEGFVLKLTVVEDPIDEKPESAAVVRTIVLDEQGFYQRLFICNYHPSKNDLQKNLGFGSKISVLNPYYRLFSDGNAAIQVDDFTAVFIHHNLKNEKICRYCGKENYIERSVPCRTCRRCYYCSKKCLNLDSLELDHDLVCKKRI